MRLPKYFPGVRINNKYGPPFSGKIGSIEEGGTFIKVRLINSILCKHKHCDIPEWEHQDYVLCEKRELTTLNPFAQQLLDSM